MNDRPSRRPLELPLAAARTPATPAPLPPPDRVLVAYELADRARMARKEAFRAEAALSPGEAARLRRLLAGDGCAGCGRSAPRGTRQCVDCERTPEGPP